MPITAAPSKKKREFGLFISKGQLPTTDFIG